MLHICLACSLFSVAIACWGGGMTAEICCDTRYGPSGNEACWDAQFTFETCCGRLGPAAASAEVESLKLDPATIPTLPLLGGGRMPVAGIGLCCRPSASGDAVRQAVLDFLMIGGRHLDDAQLYDNHYEVGKGLRQAIEMGVKREDVWLTTKLRPNDFGFEETAEWVPRMLKELGVEYVDLVLLHWAGTNDKAGCTKPKYCRQETWMALQRAHAKGLIRHLGVSNFGKRQIEELTALGGAPIEVNQLEYHPWAPQICFDTVEYCQEHGIVITAYGSMGSSRMAEQLLMQEALQQIGASKGKTAGQVMLRWAIQKGVTVIPGTSNPRHMAENLRIFDFQLSGPEMEVLNSVPEEARMLHFSHTPDARP